MKGKVKTIPEGFHTLTPFLCVRGASDAIEFYQKAFGAKEIYRMPDPGGRIGYAELQIGDSRVMVADENPERGTRGPKSLGGSPVSLMIYVEDVDRMFTRAVAAGAKVTGPLKNQFYGDRLGSLEDPFGHQWHLGSHIEDVSPEEMEIRMKEAMMAGMTT